MYCFVNQTALLDDDFRSPKIMQNYDRVFARNELDDDRLYLRVTSFREKQNNMRNHHCGGCVYILFRMRININNRAWWRRPYGVKL